MFNKYGKAKSLGDGFLFGCAVSKAGIPCLLVAPPSGGKSTVIFAVEKWLKAHGEPTIRVSRLGLRSLRLLTEFLKVNKYATVLNEDYAHIGASDYMVEKMGELIGALSYSGSFQDYGLGIDLNLTRLGFLSGIQPLWVKTMMTHTVFSTYIREKFLRFYFLPYTPSKDVDDVEAGDILSGKTKALKQHGNVQIPKEFLEALTFQVGLTRAKLYAPRITRELQKTIPDNKLVGALKMFATRIGFEKAFVQRELTDTGFSVETNWQAYHCLYWVLRSGKMEKVDFMQRLGVSSFRSVERALDKAIGLGWLTSYWNNGHRVFKPNYEVLKGSFSR